MNKLSGHLCARILGSPEGESHHRRPDGGAELFAGRVREILTRRGDHLQSARIAQTAGSANRRYLEFLSAIEDPRAGRNKLDKLSQPGEHEGRRYSRFNLFDADYENLRCSIVRGGVNISGLRNKTLRPHPPNSASAKYRVCSNGSACTDSPKRSATSITSLALARKPSQPLASFERS
jgi:hypothetical protein